MPQSDAYMAIITEPVSLRFAVPEEFRKSIVGQDLLSKSAISIGLLSYRSTLP
jgi:hypothetical protein